jgi:GNAT superfamily N-acetyltransferase
MSDGWDERRRLADGISIGVLLALPENRLAELQELYDLLDATLPRLELGLTERALRAPGVMVFAAVERASGRVVGVATLVTAPTLSCMRAWAEDLVVHPDFRGRRIAEALMDACAEAAAETGAQTMEGTVHPTRTAAIALHKRAGWEFGSSLTVRRHLPPRAASR